MLCFLFSSSPQVNPLTEHYTHICVCFKYAMAHTSTMEADLKQSGPIVWPVKRSDTV